MWTDKILEVIVICLEVPESLGQVEMLLPAVTDVEKGALSKGTGFWVLVPAVLSKASKTDCLCRSVGPGGDWPMSCHQP